MKPKTAESSSLSIEEVPSTRTSSSRSETILSKQPDTVVETPLQKVSQGRENVEDYVVGIKLILVLVSTTVVYFLMMLDMSILATVGSCPGQSGQFQLTERCKAIPYITDDFHSLLDVGWYGSAYQLARYVLVLLRSGTFQPSRDRSCSLPFFFPPLGLT